MCRIGKFILGLFILLFISTGWAEGQIYLRQVHQKMAHNYGLNGSLDILNYCGEQPESVQEVFTEAFNSFASNPNFTYANLSKNQKFRELCLKNNIRLIGSPMLGNITSDGVSVWVRTLLPAKVEIKVQDDSETKIFGPVYSSDQTDLTAIVEITGLRANEKYDYEILIDENYIDLGVQTSFVTLPLFNQLENTRITFGSCFHRWGLCNQKLFDEILSKNPHAMLVLGDNAAQDRFNNVALHRADYLLRDFQSPWKSFAANIPIYAIWDDHDYFGDDLYNIPKGYSLEDKKAVSDVFRNSWNNPLYGSGKDGYGVYFRTRIGAADVIMLDNRYFREKGNFLGNEQMKWLKEQLLDCKGPFIILANGTMFSDYVSNGKDSWGSFDPEGREELFNFIEEKNIGGVLLISGDRHGARGFKIPRISGFNFYEFGMASLGARVGAPPIRSDWDTQLYGISGEYAFGEFTFDTTVNDPEVTFRMIHEDGTVLYELKLKKSQLTPENIFSK